MRIKISDIKFGLIKVLCLLMPFHVLFFNIFEIQMFILWRDLILVVLLALTCITGVCANKTNMCIVFRTTICVLYAIIFHDQSMSASIWLNVLRIYIMPLMIMFVLYNYKVTREKFNYICRSYVNISIFVSLFGLFQMIFIGKKYLRFIGVSQASVLLADGTQRNIGVFESANVMAVYVLIAIILVVQIDDLFKNKYKKILSIVVLGVSFVFTYSMSAFLALLIICLLKNKNLFSVVLQRKKMRRLVFFVVCSVIAVTMFINSDNVFIETLRIQFEEKIVDIISTLNGTNRITTSSAAIHYQDFKDGLILLGENINGLGFAKESFMISDKVSAKNLLGVKESSYLTIMYDFGIVVGVIYLVPYFFALRFVGIKKEVDNVQYAAILISIVIIVSYIFLPLIQSYELSYFLFLFMGLILSYSKHNKSYY